MCAPTARVETVSVAFPVPLTVAVPIGVAPSMNVTVPLGVPPGPEVVAVNVTFCPKTEGLREEARVVVVLALLTVSDEAGEVLPVKLLSPP